ncbi:MAG: SWIM zinc finger family protein [Pirellulales bacterium]
MNKSILFRNYNAARALGLDRGRLNKALGLAQSKSAPKYITSADFCSCADAKYRGVTCKHQIAVALRVA